MAMTFACPGCATPFNVTDALAGKRAKCPKCAMVFALPTAAKEAVTATAAPPTRDLFPKAERDEAERKRAKRSRSDDDDDADRGEPRSRRPKKKAKSNAAMIWAFAIGGIALVSFLVCAGVVVTIAMVASNRAPAKVMAGPMAINNPKPFPGNPPPKIGPGPKGPVANAAISPRGTNLPVGAPSKGIRVVRFTGLLQVNSRLDQTDPSFENAGRIPVNGNKRCKEFVIDLIGGRHYIVDLESRDFDAYLLVETLQGQALVENDDINPPNLDSQVRFAPNQTGTYVVVATSLGAGIGNFRLTVREAQLAKPGP